MGINFGHLGIVSETTAHNADIATFFADVLGLPVKGDPAGGYAEIKLGDATIALHRGAMVDDFGPHGGTLIHCTTDDVDGTAEAIRARGGDIAHGPADTDWGTRHAYVRGPHGVLVELATPPDPCPDR